MERLFDLCRGRGRGDAQDRIVGKPCSGTPPMPRTLPTSAISRPPFAPDDVASLPHPRGRCWRREDAGVRGREPLPVVSSFALHLENAVGVDLERDLNLRLTAQRPA